MGKKMGWKYEKAKVGWVIAKDCAWFCEDNEERVRHGIEITIYVYIYVYTEHWSTGIEDTLLPG